MTIYTTPLQFGYFFSLLLWIVLFLRGVREQRLSDKMLAWVMFLLAMEMQDYTFGFAGINYLWNEMNGFPRSVTLIFGPVVYLYFRSQLNRHFRLKARHLLHALPYLIYFSFELFFFVQGPEVVQEHRGSPYYGALSYIHTLAYLGSYTYYFSKCLMLYRAYRAWSVNQFSNIDLIDFTWFRNFIYAMIFWISFRQGMNIFDAYLDWSFYQDWWWNLALVAVALYIGLIGLVQKQPAHLYFDARAEVPNDSPELSKAKEEAASDKPEPIEQEETEITEEEAQLATRLTQIMEAERLYLQPELSLSELAGHMQTNKSLLSASINKVFKQNFNDYINALRIAAFVEAYRQDEDRNYTMIALALDAGFNSKATFNRAFRKAKGMSPKAYFELSE